MPVTINGSTGLTGVAAIDNVSSTELGYVDGVTSALQTQIDSAGGMVLVKKQTFSGVTSQAISSCFSSLYTNYRMVVRITGASTSGAVQIRWGSVSSNYTYQVTRSYVTTVDAVTSNPASEIYIAQVAANGLCAGSYEICTPYLSIPTFITGNSVHYNGSVWSQWNVGGALNTTDSFTSMTIFGNGQTITGTVWVYGLKDA